MSRKHRTVLIGEFDDDDLLRLERELDRRNTDVFRFPLGARADNYSIDWEIGALPILRYRGRVLDSSVLSEADCVVFKLARMDERDLTECEFDDASERAFAAREWNTSILCALTTLLDTTAVRHAGHPGELRHHDAKLVSLSTARTVGLNVPATLVTTSCLAPITGRQLVAKSINANEKIDEARTFRTTSLSDSDLSRIDAGVFAVPSLVQQRVAAVHEIRAILIADRIVDVTIVSDDQEDEEIDLRYRRSRQIVDISIRHYVDHYLAPLIDKLRLSYCCFDILVDMEGIEWLVDITPRGTWSWYEDSDRLITQAVGRAVLEAG